jgi:hypothetical protein
LCFTPLKICGKALVKKSLVKKSLRKPFNHYYELSCLVGCAVNNKSFLSAFLIAVIFSGLILISTANFSSVSASTEASGIISSDTTWTVASSPYSLTGPVAVNEGVTLTIQPGVTVNINSYYIRVNGTLNARGTADSKIIINIGSTPTYYSGIEFKSSSEAWNGQTNSGSILQYAVITSSRTYYSAIKLESASPKIDNCIINSDSYDYAIECWYDGSPIISNNNISGKLLSHCYDGYATIVNNTIVGPAEIAINVGGAAAVSNNTLSGANQGILCHDIGSTHDFDTLMTGNLIINNEVGIRVFQGLDDADSPNVKFIIESNTIANNSRGIFLDSGHSDHQIENPPIIKNNNLFNNSQYNLETSYYSSLDASSNYWGTTNQQTINQTIFDFYDDFNLGIVTFTPFLTEPNPEAPAMPASKPAPTPTPTPVPTEPPGPTPTPSPSPIPVPGQSYFFVKSNSTVSQLFFNSTSSELSFTVSGEPGTAGYVELTIAKSLVSSIQSVKVYLDGSQINVAITEEGDSWLLTFTYQHSTHNVMISLATNDAISTFPGTEILILIAVVIVIAVAGTVGFIVWRNKKKP